LTGVYLLQSDKHTKTLTRIHDHTHHKHTIAYIDTLSYTDRVMTLLMCTALVLSWYSRVTYMHRYLVDSHTHLGFHKHHDLVKSRHTGRPNTFVF